jgi:hypothetical protein
MLWKKFLAKKNQKDKRKLVMSLFYSRANIIRGALIYAAGDTIACLITGDFMLSRVLGMMLIGGTVYAFEIPNYLLYLNDKNFGSDYKAKIIRGLLFHIYFNPLWIARHLLMIALISLDFNSIGFELISIGWYSFIYSTPFVLPANFVLQNYIPYKWRFISSAIFSGIMAVYYALSRILFN